MEHLLSPLVSKVKTKSSTHIQNLKGVLVILFWQFITGLIYNLLMIPTGYLHMWNTFAAVFATGLFALIFIILTPVAGFVADVKFSRFMTLMGSTYCMTISSTFLLLSFISLAFSVRDFNSAFYVLLSVIIGSGLLYFCGRVFFLANVLQFGTDQLRDAPTRYSVFFIYSYYWCDTLGRVLTLTPNIPGHEIIISIGRELISFDKLKVWSYIVVGVTTIVFSSTVILILYKKKQLFNTEIIGENPYKLTWRVIKFAFQHKKPLKRSAFTFCEDVIPSRLDFGKRKYGGPFTTEQVEDVKVFFNLIKIFCCFGPVFFMDSCATIVVKHHNSYKINDIFKYPWRDYFVNNGILSPFLAIVWTPVLYKVSLSKWSLNIFKRIGLSIVLVSAVFGVYLIYDILGNDSQNDSNHRAVICTGAENITQTPHFVNFSSTVVIVVQSILSSLYITLIYTSVWELICCQSPQFMKGLVFGLFYSIQALFQFFAVIVILITIYALKSNPAVCNIFFNIINICIGLIVFVMYIKVSRKYEYRKRDDICNIHQYAENYYFRESRND